MIDIVIYAEHPIYTDALLRSINFFLGHPQTINIIQNFSYSTFNILEEEHDVNFIENVSYLNGDYRLELRSGDLLIRPLITNLSIFKNKDICCINYKLGSNINNGKYDKPKEQTFNPANFKGNYSIDCLFDSGRLYKRFQNNGLVYINDKSSVIELKDIKYTTDEELNEMYISGKRICISPYMFLNHNDYLIETELSYEWKK